MYPPQHLVLAIHAQNQPEAARAGAVLLVRQHAVQADDTHAIARLHSGKERRNSINLDYRSRRSIGN